jgi:hypothetical protein
MSAGPTADPNLRQSCRSHDFSVMGAVPKIHRRKRSRVKAYIEAWRRSLSSYVRLFKRLTVTVVAPYASSLKLLSAHLSLLLFRSSKVTTEVTTISTVSDGPAQRLASLVFWLIAGPIYRRNRAKGAGSETIRTADPLCYFGPMHHQTIRYTASTALVMVQIRPRLLYVHTPSLRQPDKC